MFIKNEGAIKAALESASINLPESFNVDPGVVTRVEDAKKMEGVDPEAAYILGVVEAAKHVEAGIAERRAQTDPVAQPEVEKPEEKSGEPAEEKKPGFLSRLTQ